MTLGYVRYAVLIRPSNSNNLTLELTPRNIENIGVGIRLICRTLTDKDVPPIVKSEQIDETPGAQHAFFLANEQQKQLGKMRTVSFYVGENGFPMKPFRIHIYKADGTSHSPNTDLLDEQVFIKATKGGEWYTVDLSRYNIAAPQNGYFVAMEYVKPTSTLPQPAMDNYTASGHIMRPTFEFRKSIAWRYLPEKGWNLFPPTNGSRRYNAMVKAEVEVIE